MNPLITSWFTKATHREVASDPRSPVLIVNIVDHGAGLRG